MDDIVKLVLNVDSKLAGKIMSAGKAEIVSRLADAKFDAFTKCPVSVYKPGNESTLQNIVDSARRVYLQQSKAMGGLQKTIDAARIEITKTADQFTMLSSSTRRALSNYAAISKRFGSLSTVSYVNMGIGLVNLGVEIAGLVYLGKKLSDMEGEIKKVALSVSSVKGILTNEKITEYETLSIHFATIINRIQEKGDSVKSKDIEDLLIRFKPFISEMIRNLSQNNIDLDILLEIIYGLLPAYTGLLNIYIRSYYFEMGTLPNHSLTETFLSLYSDLLNGRLRKCICDHMLLTKKMEIADVFKAIQAQELLALNSRIQIEDLLELLPLVETEDHYHSLCKAIDKAVSKRIDTIIPDAAQEAGIDDKTCSSLAHSAYQAYVAVSS